MRHPLVLAAIRRAPVRFYGQNGWADGRIVHAHSGRAVVISHGRHHRIPYCNLYLTEGLTK